MTFKITLPSLFLFGIAACSDEWTCDSCTFQVDPEYKDPFTHLVNLLSKTQCPMCNKPRPAAAAAPAPAILQGSVVEPATVVPVVQSPVVEPATVVPVVQSPVVEPATVVPVVQGPVVEPATVVPVEPAAVPAPSSHINKQNHVLAFSHTCGDKWGMGTCTFHVDPDALTIVRGGHSNSPPVPLESAISFEANGRTRWVLEGASFYDCDLDTTQSVGDCQAHLARMSENLAQKTRFRHIGASRNMGHEGFTLTEFTTFEGPTVFNSFATTTQNAANPQLKVYAEGATQAEPKRNARGSRVDLQIELKNAGSTQTEHRMQILFTLQVEINNNAFWTLGGWSQVPLATGSFVVPVRTHKPSSTSGCTCTIEAFEGMTMTPTAKNLLRRKVIQLWEERIATGQHKL